MAKPRTCLNCGRDISHRGLRAKTCDPKCRKAYERKRRVVMECLGYNPDARGKPAKRVLEVPSEEEVRNLRLKTPPAPASRYLIEHLQAEGWPFIPQAAE